MKRALSLILMVMILIVSLPSAVMEETVETVLPEEEVVVVEAAEEEEIEVVAPPEEEDIEVVPAPVEDEEYEEVVAAPEETEEFSVEDGKLIAYNGVDETVVIPEEVTVIGEWAFAANYIVKTVVVPASVKAIEDFAFYGCENLESVEYAEGAEVEIGEHAFDGCVSLAVEEEPVEEEPVVEEPVEEEPVAEEPVEEEPVVEEPVEEEPVAEEPVAEEPVEEEPVVEEAVEEEPAEEEPVEEEPVAEEPVEEEPAEEEPSEEQPAETADETTEESAEGSEDEDEEDEIIERVSRATLAITGQPVNYTGDIGETASFTVTVTATNPSYQWQYMTTTSTTWKDSTAAAAKTKTMTVGITAARDGQKYRCIITDANGNKVYSNAVKIVVAWTKFTTQPVNYTGTVGKNASFTVKTNKTSVTYQWQYKSTASDATWKDSTLTGYNTASFTPGITVGRHGYKYRCKVTDSEGHENFSDAATLYVKAYINTQPADAVAKIGDKATFTVDAVGKSLTYQWQYKEPDGAGTNTTATGATTKTLSIESTAARNGYQYRVIVTDSFGNKATSNAATLKLPITFTTQPTDCVGAVGETAKFKAIAESGLGLTLTYKWQYAKAGTTTWKDSTADTATWKTLWVDVTEARNGQQYRCVVTDKNGNSAISDVVTLKVAIVFTTQPTDFVGAAGETAKFKAIAESSLGLTLTYKWQYAKAGTTTWKDSTADTATWKTLWVDVTEARNGQQYRCVVTDKNGNTAISNVATIKVPIVFTTQPTDFVGTVGETAKFKAIAESTLGLTLTYKWQYAKAGTTTWKDSTADTATWKTLWVEATAARHGQQYRCVVTDKNGNTAISNVATLKVPIVIDTQPVKYTGFVGEDAKFKAVATSNTGATLYYQWQYKSKTMADYADSTFESATWKTLHVPVTAARNGYYYRCVISDKAGNQVISNAAKLDIPIIITTQPKDSEDGTFTVKADGSVSSYLWYWASAGSTTFKACTSTTTGYNTATLKVVPNADRYGRQFYCELTDPNGNKLKTKTVTLKAPAIVITTQPTDQSAFPGETVTFTVATSTTGVTYQWQWRKGASGTWANSTGTGNKTGSLPIEVTTGRNGYQYQCIITDSNGVSVTSNVATLTASDEFELNSVRYKLVSGNLTVVGYTSSTKTSYTIPQTAKGYTVTKVGESAFEGNTKIKSIDLPDTITVIGKRAFANCTALTTMN